MSSRDRSDRFGDARRPPRTANDRPVERTRRVSDAEFDIDPADIDRYLSGRERTQSRDGGARPSNLNHQRTTASELDRLRRTLGQSPPRGRAPRDIERAAAPERERPRPERPSSSRQPRMRDEVAPPPEREPRRAASTSAYADADHFPTVAPEEELWEDDIPPPRRRSGAAVRRPSMPRVPQVTMHRPTLPRFIVRAELVNDPPSLAMIAAAILSLALMAVVVANRANVLPASFATHVSASGVLDNFAARESIWRLPLLTTMLTLMDIGIAWIIMRLDRFAGRILIGGALLMQCIAWVAVFRLLW